VQAPTSNP